MGRNIIQVQARANRPDTEQAVALTSAAQSFRELKMRVTMLLYWNSLSLAP